MISGRSQRRTRLCFSSTTGRGKSSYRRRYDVTLFGCDRPRIDATSAAATRSSVLTFGDTREVYACSQRAVVGGSLRL